MSVSLAEALGQVDLEAGQVYRCHVQGYLVELRVLEPAPDRPVAGFDESDVMLDPWVKLPRPTPVVRLTARAGRLPEPDIPEIPTDEDWP
ncbi:MAG: hypothetical protein JWN86_3887 [Planctomycetota bacterium]|nr:hypothetical protein [Planctomycetota bacterium]